MEKIVGRSTTGSPTWFELLSQNLPKMRNPGKLLLRHPMRSLLAKGNRGISTKAKIEMTITIADMLHAFYAIGVLMVGFVGWMTHQAFRIGRIHTLLETQISALQKANEESRQRLAHHSEVIAEHGQELAIIKTLLERIKT